MYKITKTKARAYFITRIILMDPKGATTNTVMENHVKLTGEDFKVAAQASIMKKSNAKLLATATALYLAIYDASLVPRLPYALLTAIDPACNPYNRKPSLGHPPERSAEEIIKQLRLPSRQGVELLVRIHAWLVEKGGKGAAG